MAESQVPYDYQNTCAGLIANLSDSRFKPYLISAGHNPEYAFALYLYNARISKAFLYPLHILEVSLRNRINDIFCCSFGEHWCHDAAFRQMLTQASLAALDKAIERAKSSNTADIVATLTFDFWSNLFRSEYDRALWQIRMHQLLPYVTKSRSDFQHEVRKINEFRNRIAHYEPIYKLDISQIHADLLELLTWLSADACHWVKHHSTVNQCLRTRPSGKSLSMPCVADKADGDFRIVQISEPLDCWPTEKFIICRDGNNICAVIELTHFARFILSLQEASELIISLQAHTFADVLTSCKASNNFITSRPDSPLSICGDKLKGKKQYMVVAEQQNILGVIAKAHRKY